MDKKCGTCKYHDVDGFYEYYGKNADGMGDMGFCRRMPPLPDISRLINADSPRNEIFVFKVFPETGENDWCGEWASDN